MKQLAKTYMFVTLACLGVISAPVAWAEESRFSEYELKAAFLFNFAKFVEWPTNAFGNNPSSPIIIGVLGTNDFRDDLEKTINNKLIDNRPVEVREGLSLTNATNCHVLLITAKEGKKLKEIIEALRGAPVLTVMETTPDQFMRVGGMINFEKVNFEKDKDQTRIRFRINNKAAKDARLKLSSKLLSLALPPLER